MTGTYVCKHCGKHYLDADIADFTTACHECRKKIIEEGNKILKRVLQDRNGVIQ